MSRRFRPAVHGPSIRGRVRADAGPLALVAAVITAVTLLAGATPPLLRATADDAVRQAVRDAGPDAEVIAQDRWEYDDVAGGRQRKPDLAGEMEDFRQRARNILGDELGAVLRPPDSFVTGPRLDVTDGSLLRTFRFGYLAGDAGPASAVAVTWVAGGPPRAAVKNLEALAPYQGPAWPVQVGLSEATAAALGVRPGDRIPLKDQYRRAKDVRVSGVFRPRDAADPAWRLAPWLLQPLSAPDGVGSTRLGGLLSPESLPDARLAVEYDELDRAVHFRPEPAAVTADAGRDITATLAQLKGTSGAGLSDGDSIAWQSQLDRVLRDAQIRVNAAGAQASVLLGSVLTGTVLVLALAAALLARRRAAALAAARQRGAGLSDLAAELLAESVPLAVASAAAGLLLARLVSPGVAWWWAVPLVVAAAVASPAAGVLTAARATRDRRTPANRAARRRLHRVAQVRRAAVEIAVLIAAAGAVVALRQRGILPPSAISGGAYDVWAGRNDGTALAAAAPAVGVVAGALLVVRLLPGVLRFALRRALRSSRPMAVFGAAQAAATGARALPLLATVAAAGLATFALTVGATVDRGLADAAWHTVGGDARVDVAPAAGVDVPAVTRRIAERPGVRHVVAAQVVDGARITNGTELIAPRLVIVDAAAYRDLLAATPLPDGPALAGLTGGAGGGVPALVRSDDDALRPGMRLELPREDTPPVALTAVGTAPAAGPAGGLVVVDAAAMTAAGVPVVPNTIWVTGPGAAAAVQDIPGTDAVTRAGVLDDRRGAPLTAGLIRLTWITAAVLGGLGLLGLALAAAASAPQRWQTLGRLRTMGVRSRDGRWVAAGELLPPAAAAAVGGPLLGLVLVEVTSGALALRLLAGGDAEPAVAVPWLGAGLVAAGFLAAVAVVVAAESVVRRRRGLGELLRVGG